MPKFLKNRWRGYHIAALIIISCIFIIIAAVYQWMLGAIGLILLAGLVVLIVRSELNFRKELETYLMTLSHRVKKASEEALLEMPLGILLYDEKYHIEWLNPYMAVLVDNESFAGTSLNHISEALIPLIKGEIEDDIIKINKRKLRVTLRNDERLLYFADVTELVEIEHLYNEEQTVFAIIYLDNYDEVTQGMDDQVKSSINNQVTAILKRWAATYDIYLKRISSERFFAVFNQRGLKELEKKKFSVLDEVRDSSSKENIPLTLSVGVGTGSLSLPELGQMAQSGLDLALGRGGDQVAIKQPNGKVKFFGGKSNPVEKRTRVRARVISHALRELILESDQVLIMGHKNPDMDAIGACIGILKIAEANQKKASVVVEPEKFGPGVIRLIEKVRSNKKLWESFISNELALERVTSDTLVVVVDTHKPSLVIEQRLLSKTDRIVVMDHHRRGEEFIVDPVLVYMEPYASSTSELVTELLEYQPKLLKLDVLEATSLLAGITVDTNSFTLRTGSRTFDAASYLRGHGADTILVQKLLRDDLDQFQKRAKLIKTTEIYRDQLAIAAGDEEDTYDQVILAKAADTLLEMNGIIASFVISRREDGLVGISARSFGDINVQLIMEGINGGGHLTNAATQIEGVSIEEAKQQLQAMIDQYFEGGDEE